MAYPMWKKKDVKVNTMIFFVWNWLDLFKVSFTKQNKTKQKTKQNKTKPKKKKKREREREKQKNKTKNKTKQIKKSETKQKRKRKQNKTTPKQTTTKKKNTSKHFIYWIDEALANFFCWSKCRWHLTIWHLTAKAGFTFSCIVLNIRYHRHVEILK